LGNEPRAHLIADGLAIARINRATVGLTVRLFGPHALSLHYTVSTRETHVTGLGDRNQSVETVTLSYNFLGHTRFGATEWRTAEAGGR
jgi:hypothetical protein